MSTSINHPAPQNEIGRWHALRLFLHSVEDVRRLLQPENLAIRLNLLDELDVIIGDVDLGALKTCEEPEIVARVRTLICQLETVNELLYGVARAEISLQGNSPLMHRWLIELTDEGDAEGPRRCGRPGLRPESQSKRRPIRSDDAQLANISTGTVFYLFSPHNSRRCTSLSLSCYSF